uniref:Dynein axonemal heavy chain 17 n=1 Tax=Rousettus aegyptiacus TaxID=9407 RepID=A0A7J8G6X6_ROUAE|nr:dynein axonemal heavy chain 17 [Rousettus aegyptiacus]
MTITPDVRLEYLEGVASIMLKFKPDKWGKMLSVEEHLAWLMDFLEKPDVLVLVLTLSPAGTIVPCLGFPASLKTKGVYFVKKKPKNISKDNYKDALLYGDLSPTPVDQLIAVVEEVLYSLLNQSENLSGWPWVVSEDIMKQVHKLKNEMFVMGGKIKGKTLLPVPEHLGSLDGTLESMERIPSSLDNSLLHAIETIIIDWSHQVRDVLSKDSAQALLDGLQPLPRVEFEFWDARLQNLKCIHDQLNRPKVNKIVEILEKAKSCYWPALQNVYLNVTEGLKEANDIVLYLMPLRILLEEMEQADFTMLPTFIAKVLYTICFIWATSEHYNTPSRVIVTLQEFCNQLIEMTRTYLSPEEVLKGLQGEIEEVLNNISLSVNILRELYRAYDFCCVNMELFFKPQSFLTAIMQSMARKNEWPLDKMCLSVEVTKKTREDMTAPPREGSYVYGLFMEGARWDTQTGVIAEARLKELTPAMPVIFVKAIPVDRMETKNMYECPVYKTRIRGPTYVWTFNLKTKEKAAKWVLAAVALLLQV